MSNNFVAEMLLFSVFFGIILGFSIRRIERIESGLVATDSKRYLPFVGLFWLYLAVPSILTDLLFLNDSMTQYLSLVLIICLYDCLLLFLLIPLRRIVKAKTCGWLWMVPLSGVYWFASTSKYVSKPLLVIDLGNVLSETVWSILMCVWLLGSAGVFGYFIFTHIQYKKKLIKHSYAVTDTDILQVWERERYLGRFPDKHLQLRISSQTQTPLSIGLFRRSTYVILPEKSYTAEELSLIFRHELIHIGRKDNVAKFYMLLMTALFWFNPLMWLVMRYSADDLELSCDETVLLGCNQQTRKQYAELLLTTAANQRGFTTCLSASAGALRYRMKHAMADRKRSYGVLILCAAILLMNMASLFVDFSYQSGTVGEEIFVVQEPEAYTILEAYVVVTKDDLVDCNEQPEELVEYLFDLPVSRLMRKYDDMGMEDPYLQIQLTATDNKDRTILWLSDGFLRVRSFPNGEAAEAYYQVRDPIDWNYLMSLM